MRLRNDIRPQDFAEFEAEILDLRRPYYFFVWFAVSYT
jgi:hypothetical protein